jgi:hypothetical protein
MTPEEIEEDKRRRNTEASGESTPSISSLVFDVVTDLERLHARLLLARFRAKKKQRNVALQETAAQLREKVAELEKEKEAVSFEYLHLASLASSRQRR